MKVVQLIIPSMRLLLGYLWLRIIGRKLLNQKIWTIGEKKSEARDNGYHFFNYVLKTHPEINIFYIIQKGAPDEKKLPATRVIHYGSFKHVLYCLAAQNCIGGQAHADRPYSKITAMKRIYETLKRKDQNLIWISHGVRKDKIKAFSPLVTNYALFTVATQTEYNYYKHEYSIPDNKIALTGLCRFDALHQFEKKRQILVMPTFRSWLKPKDTSLDYVSPDMERSFIDSSFYKHYYELLTNARLHSILMDNSVQLVFYLHYSFQSYRNLFSEINDPNIVVANRKEYDVQSLLKESALLITDYSSVFFDFCYMKKPVLYYQFDQEEYRNNHYSEGWFSYERDGFGPILKDCSTVINEVAKSIDNNFALMPIYKQRTENFFNPYDQNNCKRLYESILKLERK